jgi:ATP-dependent protease ClpP protease subunit
MLRNLAVADGILARARVHAQEPPRFRFHGNRNPVNRTRTPILNREVAARIRDDGTAVMRIFEPIDSWGGPWGISAVEFANALDELPDDITGIELLINSPGGEVFEALSMLNDLRDHPAKVTAKVQGLAASAASFIASAADETIMGANAQAMIHDASGIVIGNSTEMHSFADVLDKISENIASIYASKSGKPVSGHREAMHAETWYDAQEYVDAGLADSVAGDDQADDTPPEDAASFDVKSGIGAKYTDRTQAPAPGTVVDREPPLHDGTVVDLELATANARARQRQRQRAAAARS